MQAKEQLVNIKEYISKSSPRSARDYLIKIKSKIKLLASYPHIGKINSTLDIENIRDFVVFGYKIIYKINKDNILILAIYKYIDFDESKLDI
jgi:plasmid stabilization system protein ParE